MRSRASSFSWQYPLLSLRSSSSFLHLLPHLVTSICPCIFPSITCCRRQFIHKMWPIQLAFHFLISCRIFLCSLTLSNTSSFLTWSGQLIFSILLHIGGIFCDLTKVFYCVNPEILLAKLHFCGNWGVYEDWFRSCLTDRSQKVEVKPPNTTKNFFLWLGCIETWSLPMTFAWE